MTPISTDAPASGQAGFTLLELLVVVSLLALAAGLIIPNLDTTANAAFTAEVRRAVATLGYVRRQAVVTATPARAEFSTTGFGAGGLAPGAARPGMWRSSGIALAYQDVYQPAPVAATQLQLVFFPEGGSTGGTLYFARDERRASIHVDPMTGRITLSLNGEPDDVAR